MAKKPRRSLKDTLSSLPKLPALSVNSRDISKRLKKVEGATVKHARRFVFRRIDNFREVRWHIALWVLVIGIITGATGLQMAWYQQHYKTTAYAQNGTYAEAVLGPMVTLNPIFANTNAEDSIGRLLFSRLLGYDQTGHLGYDLAESVSLSEDQKTYTVKLRPDARWQDGLYVRARDVVFTVNLLKNPATRATLTGWDSITARVVDDVTVAFTLPAVYAAFPHALTLLPILPEHILRDVEPSAIRENAFSTSPVTSGPFTLRLIQEVDRNSGRKIIHLARNQQYYKGAAKLDRLQIHVYGSRDAIIKAVNNGEVNAATDLTITDIGSINSNRSQVEYKPVSSGLYALFNTNSSILNDLAVRRALQVGTDTQAIRHAISSELPQLNLPFTAVQLAGEGTPPGPTYNARQANELLDNTGWVLQDGVRQKDGKPLQLSVVALKNSDYERALEQLVTQWRALGIVVTTNVVDPSDQTQNVAQNILQPRQYDVLLYQLTLGADPDFVFAYWHSSQLTNGLNFSNYSNVISDDALSSARSRVEPELRRQKYITFARQWLDDAPAIGLYQTTAQYVYNKNVHAMPADQVLYSIGDRYASVLYWSVGSRAVYQTP